jgi:hypothetical protein
MAAQTYEAPGLTDIGSLHEMTLLNVKDATGVDGFAVDLNGDGIPDIVLGPVS